MLLGYCGRKRIRPGPLPLAHRVTWCASAASPELGVNRTLTDGSELVRPSKLPRVYMLTPLPGRSGWAYSSLCFTQPYQTSPKGLSGRPAHCPFRGLLGVHSRYGLHTRAVTNSWHANRRLQLFRLLHDCSGCFRLERLPGGICAHRKAPPFHGAHPKRTSDALPDEKSSQFWGVPPLGPAIGC